MDIILATIKKACNQITSPTYYEISNTYITPKFVERSICFLSLQSTRSELPKREASSLWHTVCTWLIFKHQWALHTSLSWIDPRACESLLILKVMELSVYSQGWWCRERYHNSCDVGRFTHEHRKKKTLFSCLLMCFEWPTSSLNRYGRFFIP